MELRGTCRCLLWFGLLPAIGLCSSCGPKAAPLYPVRGHVFYAGKPASGAVVVFHPAQDQHVSLPKPSGRVEADGTFALGTYARHDGAPAGKYVVTISWLQGKSVPADKGPIMDPPLADKLQGRYSDPKTSQWRVQVKEGNNELEAFQLPLP
jgi:hypothetical protein